MTYRLLPFALSCALLVSACAADPEQVALEMYMEEGEEIGTELSEIGGKFETLINVQGDMLAWTQAEKDELNNVASTIDQLLERANAMTPPAILQGVHPMLIEAIEEMTMAIDGIVLIANNPSKATERLAQEIEQHGTNAEKLADDYVAKLESAIAEAYPD